MPTLHGNGRALVLVLPANAGVGESIGIRWLPRALGAEALWLPSCGGSCDHESVARTGGTCPPARGRTKLNVPIALVYHPLVALSLLHPLTACWFDGSILDTEY